MGDVLWRHIGHCPLADSCLIHWEMQCLWKLWPHLPDTAEGFSMLYGGEGSGGRLTEFTVVSRKATRWTRTIKVDLTDPTDIVFWDVPAPCGHSRPLFDFDLHVFGDAFLMRRLASACQDSRE